MRTKTITRCMIVAMAVLMLAAMPLTTGVAWGALGSYGGSAQPSPSNPTPAVGTTIDVDVILGNSSFSTTNPPGLGNLIAVNVEPTQVILACSSFPCQLGVNELPGTLTFVPVGGNGCVSSVAGVTGCSENGSDPNIVDIGITPGAIELGPGQTGFHIATIRLLVNSAASPFIMEGLAPYRGIAGTCVSGSCNNVAPTNTCTNSSPDCDFSSSGASAVGSANLIPQPVPTTLTTVQQPLSGTLGVTQLNDMWTLSGGFNPTGTVTVNLYSPLDATCSGAPVFTQSFPLTGNPTPVSDTTTGGPIATMVGTWNWTASYSGDINNGPSSSACGAEPVTITQPVLQIVKTPDGTQYHAGDTIHFQIVVTNNGPGTALNVHYNPADALPDPNSSLNWSLTSDICTGAELPSCSVTGAAGSQVLNCSFGNMAQGDSCTVIVSTATQASDTGDCGNPLTLNNSATAVADNAGSVNDTGSQFCQTIPTTLTTVQQPASGNLGETHLNDQWTLTGGSNPTGTVTVNLFNPTDLTCSGTPVFTQTFNVPPTTDTTTGGPIANLVGTWNWTASYSGDANNQPSSSACGAEPVVITQPVLQIVKTPDGTQYHAGDTINFQIVVTNNGPGTALNVHYNPADALPDPNSSLNWSFTSATCSGAELPSCSVTGAAGSQVLNCSFGNMAQGDSCTVIVSTATQASDPGDCGNPLTLNNSATAVADNAASVNDTGSQFCSGIPHLTLVKTPDGATYNLGNTVSFTIVVTNNGTAIAHNVHFDPLDALPDPNASLDWALAAGSPTCTGAELPSCTVTGAVGSQVLSCTFGDMAPNDSCTVTVSTDTQTTDPSDCTALNNEATAVDNEGDSASDTGSQSCTVTAACRMTGGHNVFTSDGSSITVEGGAVTDLTTTVKTKVNGRLTPVTDEVSYTTGGQIGAPQATGCCDTPPNARCLNIDPTTGNGVCVGGTNNGGTCANQGDCPSSNGRSSDCPWGDWQHTHHSGIVTWEGGGIFGETTGNTANNKAASFDFHSGTAAAPQGAFIENIICDDPGWCVQARCAPDKQIFWEGTGIFRSASNIDPSEEFAKCVTPGTKGNKTPSIHYYRAHVGDFGEPAGNKQKPASFASCGWNNTPGVSISSCNLNGVEPLATRTCGTDGDCGQHGTCDVTDDQCVASEPFKSEGGQICTECADWYEIEIHCDATPMVCAGSDFFNSSRTSCLSNTDCTAVGETCQPSPIIYKVGNFIREGNFQIHPEVGTSCQNP
jgi:uncharacterized repeat protein (TIGR01451 family)